MITIDTKNNNTIDLNAGGQPPSAGGWVDLHVHTNRSDGQYNLHDTIERAVKSGVRSIAVTDHNICLEAFIAKQLSHQYGIEIIPGCEFSATAAIGGGGAASGSAKGTPGSRADADSRGSADTVSFREIHIIGLFTDETDPEVRRILKINKKERKQYIQQILTGLQKEAGIFISYEDLIADSPDSAFIGRQNIARYLVRTGVAPDVNAAFREYLGGKIEGDKKHDYISYNFTYASLPDTVQAILHSGGLPVLAHLPYYGLTDFQEEELLQQFKDCGGVAMETDYKNYPPELIWKLSALARAFDLLPSCGSDYHGSGDSFHKGSPHLLACLKEKKRQLAGL